MPTEKQVVQQNKYLEKHHPELFVALNFHKTHKNNFVTFDKMEYLKAIYIDKADYIAFKKATQMGITEYLTLRAMVGASVGRGVFYVLPTTHLVGRFVKNRIDRSIEYTPYYRRLVRMSPGRFAENVSLKHIGKGSIAFVGSNSTAGFTEYPADDLIIDEKDECHQENLPMAYERLSASEKKRIIEVGNPTVLGIGIDATFDKSDKKEWKVKCPHCNRRQKLDFFENVVDEVEPGEYVVLDDRWEKGCGRDIRVLCTRCHKPLDRHAEGMWIPSAKSDISGYHISKLYAKNVSVTELVERFEAGLVDDTKLQRFYNGDLGLAYTASGAKLTYEMLRGCMSNHSLQNTSEAPCVIGIDVGNRLHTVISEILPGGKLKLVYIAMLQDPEQILSLKRMFNIKFGIIDALPEKRMSKKLIGKIRGLFMAYYGKDVKKTQINLEQRYVVLDRTASLDEVKAAVLSQTLIFPRNADKMAPLASDDHSEFFYELTTATRVYNDKRETYDWVEGGLPDHFFHAMNYMLSAHRIFVKSKT